MSQSSGASRKGSHRLDSWACPRKFAYGQILHLEPVTEPAARGAGSLMHLGAMHYWNRRVGRSALDPREELKRAPARIAYTYPTVAPAFEAYAAWHDAKTPTENVLAIEDEFAITGEDGRVLHTVRFDRLEAVGDSGVISIDTKTSKRESTPEQIASEYEKTTQFVTQRVFGEHVIAPALGRRFLGTYVEVVRLVPPYPITLVRVRPPDHYMEEWAQTVAEKNAEIDAYAATHPDPWSYRMDFSQCSGRWGRCEYEALCLRGKSALSEFVVAVDAVTKLEGK